MPRTVDHIVHTHQLARKRIASGRPVWDEKINLADLFHNDDLPFEEMRDTVVARIRASRWFRAVDEFDDLFMLIEELADTPDPDEFNGVLDYVYDQADIDRIWIGTI